MVAESIFRPLVELYEYGFSLNAIASMAHEPLDKVARWLGGAVPPDESCRRISYLAHTCRTVGRHVTDVERWFDTPIVQDVAVTPIDLFCKGDFDLILAHATKTLSPDNVIRTLDSQKLIET